MMTDFGCLPIIGSVKLAENLRQQKTDPNGKASNVLTDHLITG